MKKVTVKSNFHNTEATFYVPESVEDSSESMEYLDNRQMVERNNLGRHGPARKQYLEVWRKLCGVDGCTCWVVKEAFENE